MISGWLKKVDWILVLIPIALVAIGVVTIYSTTLGTLQHDLALKQGLFFIVGIVLMVLCSYYDYRGLRSAIYFMYLLSIALLVVVLILGKEVFGATRWIDLGFFQLQPSELLKISLLMLFASEMATGIMDWKKKIVRLIIASIIPVAMILYQPDLGTAIIICITLFALIMYWPIGKGMKIAIVIAIIAALPLGWLAMKDYQRQRIVTFMNPGADPYGSGYNVIQSTIAVGSGSLWGNGLGNGPQSQLHFLPVAHTDFVFAGWAEATGFIGSFGLVVLELVLVWRLINIASKARDDFGRYITLGFAVIMLSQIVINIGMNIGLAPVTGIPLPFVSSGGTALIVNFIMLGIIQNIYLRQKSQKY